MAWLSLTIGEWSLSSVNDVVGWSSVGVVTSSLFDGTGWSNSDLVVAVDIPVIEI